MASTDVETTPQVEETENEKTNGDNVVSPVKRALESEETPDLPAKKQKVSDEPPSELEKKIIRQIEYYFGDVNLSRDKFMLGKIAEDNGWITLAVLLTFKRLASLTTDTEVIINALQKSETQLVQISDDKTKLRRAPELPIPEVNEERKKELTARRAYVKGFPLTADISDLLKWFEEKGYEVENIFKRCYLDKTSKKFMFKGSIFVLFKTVDECRKFIENAPYNYDTEKSELTVMWQEKYFESKAQERLQNKESRSKLKGMKDTKLKEIEDYSVIHVSNLNEDIRREDIKDSIAKLNIEPKYVDTISKTEAYVRLKGTDAAKELVEKVAEGQLEVKGVQCQLKAIEGEELNKFAEKMKDDMNKKRNMGGGNRKRGRKHRGGNRD